MSSYNLQVLTKKTLFSARISQFNIYFLKKLSNQTKTPISQHLERALDFYRKFVTWQDLQEAGSEQTKEDVSEAMSDFGDYLNIIESAENKK